MAKRYFPYFRIVRTVLKSSGLSHACVVFLAIFFVCALIVRLFDPSITHAGDALWYCFQVVTTIGFGDVTVTSPVARIVSVVLSIISVFFIAIITGVAVNVTTEVMKARRNESVAVVLDKLEHLPDLSKEELTELSNQIKKIDYKKH